MTLTKEEIADINSVINKKEMDESDAKNIIKRYLNDSEVNVNTNLELLVALKTVFINKFGIHDYEIRYVVDDYSNVNSLAFHESGRGDKTILIGVDSKFLIEPSKVNFLKTMLHEFGHLNMFLLNKEGKKQKKSVFIAGDVGEGSIWQIVGALSSYNTCGSERYADKFAHSTMNSLIKQAGCLDEFYKEFKDVERKENNRYVVSKILHAGWSVGNAIIGFRQPKKFKVFYNSDSYDKQLSRDNQEYAVVYDMLSLEKPEEYVKHHVISNDASIKGFSKEKKMRILVKAFLKYSLVMASKCGVHPQELGFLFSDYYSKPEYVITRESNPDSPLLGYFIYPTRKVNDVKSLGQFFKELDECYNEKVGSEQQL